MFKDSIRLVYLKKTFKKDKNWTKREKIDYFSNMKFNQKQESHKVHKKLLN